MTIIKMPWLLFVISVVAVAPTQARPNPTLTPGVLRPLTVEELCTTKWGDDPRAVTEQMKRDVATAYGIPWGQQDRYEFDHLIPRSLGGADSVLNLWPQPLAEAKKKDALERHLRHEVCVGHVPLADAQEQMRRWGQ